MLSKLIITHSTSSSCFAHGKITQSLYNEAWHTSAAWISKVRDLFPQVEKLSIFLVLIYQKQVTIFEKN